MFFRQQFAFYHIFCGLVSVSCMIIVLILTLYFDYCPPSIPAIKFKQSLNLTDVLQSKLMPRIFCLIITAPKYFLTRTRAVNDTWAPRCDRYFFVTESLDQNATSELISFAKQIPIAPIKNLTSGYDHLTQKSSLAFLFAYEKYLNDYEWFFKGDDDTYLFVDHLRLFLTDKNTSEPVTYGYNFKVSRRNCSIEIHPS